MGIFAETVHRVVGQNLQIWAYHNVWTGRRGGGPRPAGQRYIDCIWVFPYFFAVNRVFLGVHSSIHFTSVYDYFIRCAQVQTQCTRRATSKNPKSWGWRYIHTKDFFAFAGGFSSLTLHQSPFLLCFTGCERVLEPYLLRPAPAHLNQTAGLSEWRTIAVGSAHLALPRHGLQSLRDHSQYLRYSCVTFCFV